MTVVDDTTARRPDPGRPEPPRRGGGWRVPVGFLLAFVLLVAGAIAEGLVAVDTEAPVGDVRAGAVLGRDALAEFLYLGIVVGGLALLVRVLHGGRLGEWLALTRRGRPSARQAGLGALLGLAMMAVVLAVGLSTGLYDYRGAEWSATGTGLLLAFLVGGAMTTAGSAIAEELVTRGYWFSALTTRLSLWPSVLIVAVPFALLHFAESGFGLGFVVSAISISAFLVFTRLITGALWFAIGWHVAWNLAQYQLLGTSTTDDAAFGHALLHFDRVDAELWLGEGHAIESGLLPMALLVAAAAAAWVTLRRQGGAQPPASTTA